MSLSATARLLRTPSSEVAEAPARSAESTPSTGELTDEALLALICDGDKDALTSLFRRYARLVRSVAIRILRNGAEAEDLVQDVFLYIFNKCRTFQSSRGTARSWIVQITYHRGIDRRRYLVARRFYDQVDVDDPGLEIPDERAVSALYDQSVEAVLGSEGSRQIFDLLSPDQQETLRLFFFDGYTFDEIAKLRGQTLGNVRNHYYRGLEKIRQRVFSKKHGR